MELLWATGRSPDNLINEIRALILGTTIPLQRLKNIINNICALIQPAPPPPPHSHLNGPRTLIIPLAQRRKSIVCAHNYNRTILILHFTYLQ